LHLRLRQREQLIPNDRHAGVSHGIAAGASGAPPNKPNRNKSNPILKSDSLRGDNFSRKKLL
jgi:hypothetical protein